MQGAFVAQGPAFQSSLFVSELATIDVYNLMCAVLGIKPAPNSGSYEKIKPILNNQVLLNQQQRK